MGYMMPCGPFWLYSSLMSKYLLKGQGSGNVNFQPPLHVFFRPDNSCVCFNVQEGLFLQSSLCRGVTKYRDQEQLV